MAPVFAFIDNSLAEVIGPLARLIFWGCAMGAVSMGLYQLASPQRRLTQSKAKAAELRRQIAEFDGEFAQLRPVITQSLTHSLKHIGLTLLPAVLASIPLVACVVSIYSVYHFRALVPGDVIAVSVSPDAETIAAAPADSLQKHGDVWDLTWPAATDQVVVFDRAGATLTSLERKPASDVVERFYWLNRLIGNPLGYIPQDSSVDRLEFALPRFEVLAIGPPWLRGWEAPFFVTLILTSILIKVVFRIE